METGRCLKGCCLGAVPAVTRGQLLSFLVRRGCAGSGTGAWCAAGQAARGAGQGLSAGPSVYQFTKNKAGQRWLKP